MAYADEQTNRQEKNVKAYDHLAATNKRLLNNDNNNRNKWNHGASKRNECDGFDRENVFSNVISEFNCERFLAFHSNCKANWLKHKRLAPNPGQHVPLYRHNLLGKIKIMLQHWKNHMKWYTYHHMFLQNLKFTPNALPYTMLMIIVSFDHRCNCVTTCLFHD